MKHLNLLCCGLALIALPGCLEPVATVERDFPVGEADRIYVEDGGGDIELVGEEDRTTVTVVAQLMPTRVSGRNDDAAKRSIVVDYVVEDGKGEIIHGLDDPPSGYVLDLIAYVPERMAISIDDERGDIVVAHVGQVEVTHGHGDLDVRDIAEEVRITQGGGDIAVANVGGLVDIDDGGGDISVSGAAADVIIRDGKGDIHVRAAGDVQVLEDAGGDVDIP